jgi:hypothetical protein
MDKRMVSKILKQKHDDFLKSIDDEETRKLIDKNSIITGGAIVSLLLNEKVKDFDYYFTDEETCFKVANYFVKKFNKEHPDKTYLTTTKLKEPKVELVVTGESPNLKKRIRIVVPSAGIVGEADSNDYQYFEGQPNEVGQDYVDKIIKKVEEADDLNMKALEDEKKEKYRVVFMSSNAITLSNQIQLVIRFYGPAEEIHKNYDFIHCTNWWNSKDATLVLNQSALESILAKRLYYVGSLYPVCSVIRTRKFIERGWRINAGQYLKMLFQVSELDLTNIEVLEDQLVGVDCAYFYQVVDWCKQKQTENPEFKVTAPYLVSIIDKIFG